MTVRVTTLSGSAGGIGEYYGDQLGGYYGDGGPGGFWFGRGAQVLGLAGQPTAEQITTLMTGHSPRTGERLGRRFREAAGPEQKPSARGYDTTFSVPKDVSVLWALGSEETCRQIEEALQASVVAVLSQHDQLAPIRARGEVRQGSGLAVAVIPEHTSRLGDPNLHVHAVVSSKVQDPETGKWYALDARGLKQHQEMMSAQFHRCLEAELSVRLRVGWGERSQRYAAPLAGSNAGLCDALSSRTGAVKRRLALKLDRFENEYGRAPSAREAWRLEREAAAESRPTKTSIDESGERDRWATVAADFGGSERVVGDIALAGREPIAFDGDQLSEIATAALAEVSEQRSSWRRGHLVTEIARMIPSGIDVSAARIVAATNRAADQMLESVGVIEVGSADDGVTQMYTTVETLGEELTVIEWASDAVEPGPGERSASQMKVQVARFAERELSDGQLAAAAVAAGDGQFEVIVGPAGTGKTTSLKAAVASLRSEDRPVFGVAPSGAAAKVLGTETGCRSANVTKFLWEQNERDTGPDPKFQLPVGATLLVDEAGMVRTSDFARLCELAEVNQWRLVSVGDGFQFSAVGRGGMFEHLTTALPSERVTHLDRVHRFTNQWEAQASLRLRTGDADVLDTYQEHKRLLAMESDDDATRVAVAMWDRYEQAGEQFAVFSTRNETVRDLNAAIQAHRHQTGLVSSTKMIAGRSHQIGVGDHVVARRNDRGLNTDRGHWVRNRDTFVVTNVTETSITARGSTGTVELPADYVNADIELAYAQTSHAGQGRTVDHSLLVIAEDDTPDRAGVYVPMTRGRKTNRAVVATGTPRPSDSEAVDRLAEALQRRWIDSPAMSEMADTHEEQRAAARAAVDHVKEMAKRNRHHQLNLRRGRPRAHPLHLARGKQLEKQYKQLIAATIEPPSQPAPVDARAEAIERIRRTRAKYNLPDPHEPDIGI